MGSRVVEAARNIKSCGSFGWSPRWPSMNEPIDLALEDDALFNVVPHYRVVSAIAFNIFAHHWLLGLGRLSDVLAL